MTGQYTFGLPTKTRYAEYVVLENVFSDDEITFIRNLWNPNNTLESLLNSTEGNTQNQELRQSSLNLINPEEPCTWIFERLSRTAIDQNLHWFNFDLHGLNEGLQLARYNQSDLFNWHMDYGGGLASTRKLSISLQLSEPEEYEGGDLQFMINDQHYNMPRAKGTVIVFPSYMVHRVTPIASGTRMSLVGWVHGMPFR